MTIRILDEAEQDLVDGFRFYEIREPGLGDYFLDSLFADIDSLHLYAGSIQSTLDITVFCPKDSHSRSTTRSSRRTPTSGPSWIAVKILRRSQTDCLGPEQDKD